MTEQRGIGTVFPSVFYRDAPAAIEWLGGAFGFEKVLVVPGEADGTVAHSELRFGEGVIMVSTARAEDQMSSPRDTGSNTQSLYIYAEDIDGLYHRAKSAGAEVLREPENPEYGGRVFGVRDPEGHTWYFGSYRPGSE